MEIWKELIPGPCTVAYPDKRTGEIKRATFTPEYNKYLCDQGNAMIASGLSIPVPVEHQQLSPMTAAERAAADLKNNAGWVMKNELREGDKLWQLLDIQNEELYKQLPKTVRFTSPNIESFTDGNGKRWDGVITHTALTTRPRLMGQKPFESMAAALSLIGSAPDVKLNSKNLTVELLTEGFSFCRAGALKKSGKKLKPMYPGAFSLLTGAALSREDIDEMGDEDDDDNPEDEKEEFGKAKGKGAGKAKRAMPMDEQEDEFEEACDLGFCELIQHLLTSNGLNPPQGMSEQTFERDLYETLMAGVRDLAEKGRTAGQQPKPDPMQQQQPGKKNMGQNPIVQESPPMYASLSLEQVQKITDPEKRQLAEMCLSLQESQKKTAGEITTLKAANDAAVEREAKIKAESDANKKRAEAVTLSILEDAKTARKNRVEAVKKRLPKKHHERLDKLLANAAMSLSLGDNGVVVDPMTEQLEFAEDLANSIPDMLREGVKLSQVDHPPAEGVMTEGRADEIVGGIMRDPVTK